MSITSSSPDPPATATQPAVVPLVDGVVFLARYFGTAIEREALVDAVQMAGAAPAELLAACCARAGLAASALSGGDVRTTMLPALVQGAGAAGPWWPRHNRHRPSSVCAKH